MKRILKPLVFASLLLMGASVYAQDLRTGYFMEGYSYRYRFNPALTAQRNFLAIPGVGDVAVAVQSNLSLSNFLPDTGAGMTGFMDPNYSYTFIKDNLKPQNKANIGVNEAILAAGFWTKNVFHSIELDAVVNGAVNIPDQLFEFMKQPQQDKEYVLKNLTLNANAMTQLAYGLSIPIGKHFRLGARAKFLVGLGGVDMNVENVSLKYDSANSSWSGSGSASVDINLPSLAYFPTKGEVGEMEGTGCSPERADRVKFTDVQFNFDKENPLAQLKGIIPGFGAALDLGFSLDFADYCTLSAAVTDLGFLRWKNTQKFTLESEWSFGGFQETNGAEQTLSDQYDQLSDDLDDCLPFIKAGSDKVKTTSMMEMTVNAAFELRMPFYDRWSIGLLAQTDLIGKRVNWYEGRVVTTITPTNWFSFGASYAYNTFGHNFGCMLTLNMRGFNLFVGADSLLPAFKLTESCIPYYKTNTNVSVGLNIAFGRKNHIRYVLPTING